NINKCILGIGDARLIASNNYKWKAIDRAGLLNNELYTKALEWKFRPQKEAICSLDEAREQWLKAVNEIKTTGKRTLYNTLRWLARRHTLGDLRTIGLPPVVRILRSMYKTIQQKQPFPPSLKKDWQIFN
ncbi:MAG: hypothetical protein IJS08_12230, partial [Victivallales bacterium]|nr:hypothetical protein [Victivallales bacterium]